MPQLKLIQFLTTPTSLVKQPKHLCVKSIVQNPQCSWAAFFPTSVQELGSHSSSLVPSAAQPGQVVLAQPAPSPWRGWSKPCSPAAVDPEGFEDRGLSADASTPWSGAQFGVDSSSAGWRSGTAGGMYPVVMNRHRASKQHRWCTNPQQQGGVPAHHLHPAPYRNRTGTCWGWGGGQRLNWAIIRFIS